MRFLSILCTILLSLIAHADDTPGHQFAAQAYAYTNGLSARSSDAFMSYVTGVSTMAEATDFICPERTTYPEILHVVAAFVLANPDLWTKRNSFELTTAALVSAYPC